MKIKHFNIPTQDRAMLVRYWNPWREMETLRRQVDRMLDEIAAPSEYTWTPAIELHDSGEALTLKAQLPGMDAKDINVEATREAVALSGEYRNEQQSEGVIKSEFRYGKFRRIVPLPVAVQNDQVQAEYKDGILTLTLPKVVEVRNKVVKLNLADLTQNQPAIEPTIEATESVTEGQPTEANS